MVFCLRSSSIRLTVTSFSRSVDSLVAIGGVTPRNLLQDGAYGIVSVSASSSLPLIVVHLHAGDEEEDLCLSCQSFVREELEPGRESCGQARCQLGAYVIQRVTSSVVGTVQDYLCYLCNGNTV